MYKFKVFQDKDKLFNLLHPLGPKIFYVTILKYIDDTQLINGTAHQYGEWRVGSI